MTLDPAPARMSAVRTLSCPPAQPTVPDGMGPGVPSTGRNRPRSTSRTPHPNPDRSCHLRPYTRDMANPSDAHRFEVVSPFGPAGDQPKAIESLAEGVDGGERYQTLLGITGSGKSATVAWMIEKIQRPTLVIAPNKSLAAQLASEFRSF